MSMTRMVKLLLIANVALFLLTGLLRVELRPLFGLTPYLVLHGMVWQLFSYMFLHADLGHILFNMLALWMFGVTLEQTWGSRRFLRFYLICGIGSGVTVVLASVLFSGQATTTIGASGAIYGLLLAFGLMFPNARVLAFLFFPMPARYFVILMGAISFYMAAAGSGGTVSHIAHLGGLLVGYLYLKLGSRRSYSSYSSARRSRLATLLSWEEWRIAFDRWRRRRLRKKFEVYMRKHEGNDRWVQ
jgi:membrane associated rhomboid family serine protease